MPLHFSAFHPDWKMLDHAPTPPATLTRAREIAMRNGLRYVYTGNVHDRDGGSTWCHRCDALLIERDWYELGRWGLTADGSLRGVRREAARRVRAAAGHLGLEAAAGAAAPAVSEPHPNPLPPRRERVARSAG